MRPFTRKPTSTPAQPGISLGARLAQIEAQLAVQDDERFEPLAINVCLDFERHGPPEDERRAQRRAKGGLSIRVFRCAACAAMTNDERNQLAGLVRARRAATDGGSRV